MFEVYIAATNFYLVFNYFQCICTRRKTEMVECLRRKFRKVSNFFKSISCCVAWKDKPLLYLKFTNQYTTSKIVCLFPTDMNSKRYLGKAPIHQLYLDTLIDTFPDATLIYTYRPLTEVLPSNLSLLKHGIDPMGFDTNSNQWINR